MCMTYYTVDDLRPGRPGWDVRQFSALAEAIDHYRTLPMDGTRVLGMMDDAHAYELIRCVRLFPGDAQGEDVLAADYRRSGLTKKDASLRVALDGCLETLHPRFLLEPERLVPVPQSRKLREELRDSVTQLLYISGQQQYAMALFDTRPLNFLLKPLDEAKLLNCVVQAIRLSRPEEAVLTVLVERTPRALPTQAIRYIESYHKRITVHSVQHELVCRDKLDTVARQLPEQFFLRIHQSFLVNTLYVRRIQYDRLTLDDGTELPISQSYRRVVRGRLLRWTPGGMVL
mgnify:FL=1